MDVRWVAESGEQCVDYSAVALDAQWEILLVGWKVEQWAVVMVVHWVSMLAD